MLLLVCSPTHGVETTSLQFCVNCTIGCRYKDEWSLRLHVWNTDRLRQQHRRTSLPTFNSSPSMVAIFLQNARCSADAYRLLSLLNFGESRCRRNECVEQFCGYSATDYYLPLRLFDFFLELLTVSVDRSSCQSQLWPKCRERPDAQCT